MCHEQRREHGQGQEQEWWNEHQYWKKHHGPFDNERMDFRNFNPFWIHGGHRGWNRAFNESIHFSDEKNQFEILYKVPGIAKDKINVKANKEFLYVSIDNRLSEEDSVYERHFPFRSNIDLKKIKAKYNNGLLTIEVPLLESEKQEILVE